MRIGYGNYLKKTSVAPRVRGHWTVVAFRLGSSLHLLALVRLARTVSHMLPHPGEASVSRWAPLPISRYLLVRDQIHQDPRSQAYSFSKR